MQPSVASSLTRLRCLKRPRAAATLRRRNRRQATTSTVKGRCGTGRTTEPPAADMRFWIRRSQPSVGDRQRQLQRVDRRRFGTGGWAPPSARLQRRGRSRPGCCVPSQHVRHSPSARRDRQSPRRPRCRDRRARERQGGARRAAHDWPFARRGYRRRGSTLASSHEATAPRALRNAHRPGRLRHHARAGHLWASRRERCDPEARDTEGGGQRTRRPPVPHQQRSNRLDRRHVPTLVGRRPSRRPEPRRLPVAQSWGIPAITLGEFR
jgi:hypothetical protein